MENAKGWIEPLLNFTNKFQDDLLTLHEEIKIASGYQEYSLDMEGFFVQGKIMEILKGLDSALTSTSVGELLKSKLDEVNGDWLGVPDDSRPSP